MSTYHRHVPNTWWLQRRPYILFMIRELTSVFVAGYCIFLLVFVFKLTEGADAYANFMAAQVIKSAGVEELITIKKYKKQAVFIRLKKKGLRQMAKLGF